MPSQSGSCQICEAEEVETATEDDASDAIKDRAVPGNLRSVDGQMGGIGSLEALFGENLCALLVVHMLRRN